MNKNETIWPLTQKIAFRFFGCYILLYCLSNQFLFFTSIIDPLWRKVVPWFGQHILHLPNEITIFTNGSGDTTFNYVSLVVYLIVSLITTIIWSIIDHKRGNYNTLLQWLEILVRYYVIIQMINYGMAKVFYLQFRPPHFAKLVQTFGDSSPMGLLWTFMGFSKGYTIFAGAGELLGGLLLLFPRMKTLGAIVVLGVMVNVMAMNFFYDVPVKILSSHLVLIALVLVLLDGKRLLNLFFLNKATSPRIFVPLFKDERLVLAKDIIKWALITLALAFSAYQMIGFQKRLSQQPPLYGLYEVESFESKASEKPAGYSTIRWKWLAVEWKDRATIISENGTQVRYDFIPDTTSQNLTLNSDTLDYHFLDNGQLLIEGIQDGDTIKVQLKTKLKNEFPLINRGFNWINEYPFNK